MANENGVSEYKKPSQDKIPYIIAARSVFSSKIFCLHHSMSSVEEPEGRENERGLFYGPGRKTPYVLFIHREYWDALPAKSVDNTALLHPLSLFVHCEYLDVLLVKSYEPLIIPVNHICFTDTGGRSCVNQEDCKEAVCELQKEHMK